MSEFLENLKKAADSGEFNSDAAKKINAIGELANNKTAAESSEELDKRLEAVGVKNVTAEEAVAINSSYEKEMEKIKQDDAVNKQIATLIEIDDMVLLSISDMFEFVDGLEEKFEEKLKEVRTKQTDEKAKENAVYVELDKTIEDIKIRYKILKKT